MYHAITICHESEHSNATKTIVLLQYIRFSFMFIIIQAYIHMHIYRIFVLTMFFCFQWSKNVCTEFFLGEGLKKALEKDERRRRHEEACQKPESCQLLFSNQESDAPAQLHCGSNEKVNHGLMRMNEQKEQITCCCKSSRQPPDSTPSYRIM